MNGIGAFPMGTARGFLALAVALAFGAEFNSRSEVLVEPPGATVAGKTIGEWTAAWWQWAAAQAPPGDAFTDTSGQYAGINQSGPVFFLAGSPNGYNDRQFDVPTNTYILLPLLAGELSQLEIGFDKTEADIRQAAAAQANNIDSLHVLLDWVTIPSTNLFAHREVSPPFSFTSVPNNHVGIPAGQSGIAIADGYFLMLAPLSPGAHYLSYGGGASVYGISVNEYDAINAPIFPAITSEPKSQTATEGQNVMFTVGASGRPLHYQWIRNQSVIPGQTEKSLSLPAVTANDAGGYRVYVGNYPFGGLNTNVAGSVYSDVAFLTVNPAPSINLNLNPKRSDLVLSWSTNAVGFTLQSSTNLAPSAIWGDVTNLPVVVNDQLTVTSKVTGHARFFRLRKL